MIAQSKSLRVMEERKRRCRGVEEQERNGGEEKKKWRKENDGGKNGGKNGHLKKRERAYCTTVTIPHHRSRGG